MKKTVKMEKAVKWLVKGSLTPAPNKEHEFYNVLIYYNDHILREALNVLKGYPSGQEDVDIKIYLIEKELKRREYNEEVERAKKEAKQKIIERCKNCVFYHSSYNRDYYGFGWNAYCDLIEDSVQATNEVWKEGDCENMITKEENRNLLLRELETRKKEKA